MNRFWNGLLIPRGHVTSEISHHSDIDISKFHSRLFCVIGFFRCAPKISLIRPRFFYYFSRVADMLNSLWREFHFFPTTLSFWDFWGSVGTFCFFVVVVPEFQTLSFVLSPTRLIGMSSSAQSVAVMRMTQLDTHFFIWLGSRGG